MNVKAIDTLRHSLGLYGRPALQPLMPGLDAAALWLARAQDATPDDGVAAFYDTRKKAWAASYPETTGYIIPTLYDYAALTGNSEFHDRATRMAAWECDIQFAEGGVRAGYMDAPEVVPTIFNTGQVLFGWVSAFEKTGDTRFADSLRRACDWLVAAQDEDGAWRRFGSPFSHAGLNTYNTRVAYGLALAARVLDDTRYAQAAKANIDWALTQASPNGWFENNDLEHNDRPLTHTIAYATRGVMEVGDLLDVPDYIDRARVTAAAVAQTQRKDGALPGRLDKGWKPAARWSCLTGNVQMAIIWLRLAAIKDSKSHDWLESARSCIAFVQSVQDNDHADAGQRGGIAGSAPMRGEYMRHRLPNWAANFYMDAVMKLAAAESD
ncbi:MAG: hypothetical protein PF501_07000 [Salinisphaera sp.]|jgi:hypothetical protein|nr:hypothetical protein [Salinisphaera sp.]